MNMPPHAERGAATKSRLLCRNLSRLMKSMRTALGAPARCTARCGVSPTSTMPCRATIKSRTFWQRWAGFILIFLPTAGRSFAQYPQQLDDKFIATLLQQVPYIVLSIAIQPVETEDAYREIEDSRMKTDAEKVRFNRKTVENLDFVATVPYKTQAQEKNIEYIRTEMAEHFFFGCSPSHLLVALIVAKTQNAHKQRSAASC